jgi:hypothetical protein
MSSIANVINVIDGQGELSGIGIRVILYNQQDATTYGTVSGNCPPTAV